MKKLLAMVMAMTMLCASMGVLAEEEETVEPIMLPASYGFEDEETNIFSFSDVGYMRIVESDGGSTEEEATETAGEEAVDETVVLPHSGNKMLKMWRTGLSDKECSLNAKLIQLEKNSRYKISFWHRSEVGKAPYIIIKAGNEMYIKNVNRNILSAGTKQAWNYYEVLFTTTENTALSFNFVARGGQDSTTKENFEIVDYYDDFRLEKLKDANVSIFAAKPAYLNHTNIDTYDAKSRTSYFNPATTFSIEGAADNIHVYPTYLRGTPVTEFKGSVTVTSHYYPRKLGEKTILTVGIYKDENGTPILKGIESAEYTYNKKAEDIAEGKVVSDTYPAHQRLDLNVNNLTISADDYEAGCYLRVFMWSSVSGLIPISGTTTLPAAPVVETPAA